MPYDAPGIYIIKNTINDKVYIGSAVNIKRRFGDHKSRLKHSKHNNAYLQRAWNKYGKENFKFEVLEFCAKEILNTREEFYISKFKATNENHGYNSCLFGTNALGRKHSEETKIKIGLKHKGKKVPKEVVEIIANKLRGKKRDPELMLRIAASRKGQKRKRKPRTPEQIEKIRRVNIELANRRWGNKDFTYERKHDLSMLKSENQIHFNLKEI